LSSLPVFSERLYRQYSFNRLQEMSVRWISLELNRGQPIDKQVNDVVKTFETLYKQAEQRRVPNIGQVVKAVRLLRPSINERIAELEAFYRNNDVDPRASSFESARVKLKRLVTNCPPLAEEGPPQSPAGAATGKPVVPAAAAVDASGGRPTSPVQASKVVQPPQPAQGFPGLRQSVAMTPTTAPPQSTGSAKTVVVRVIMTHEEYEDVKLRRDALRQMMMLSTRSTSPKPH
jgi:hypothetical protein